MSISSNSQKLRVAIIGGGIGGLTCAIALKARNDIEVDLYEAAAQITEIGAGIATWPRTWDIVKSLGLEEDLLKLVKDDPTNEERLAFEFRISDRSEPFTFHKLIMPEGKSQRWWHRQEIQQALLKRVPSYRIHLSRRLIQCEELEDSVKLHFQDGTTAWCDVAIGADGIKSVVRQAMHSHNPVPNNGVFYTGTRAFRGLIPRAKLAEMRPGHRTLENGVMYCGKDKHLVVYPISRGRFVNVVAFFSKVEDEGKTIDGAGVRDSTVEEMLEMLKGWEQDVIDLLNCIENPKCWTIRDLHPLNKYTSRRLALLGDAAHAMTPHLGAGAGQAIDDGYILGGLFAHTSAPSTEAVRVLEVYNTIRQPFGTRVRNNARSQGFYYELNATELKEVGQELSSEQIDILRTAISDNWKWAWEESAIEDMRHAIEMLEGGVEA